MQIKEFLKTIEGLAKNTRSSYEQTLWQINSVIKANEPSVDDIYRFLSGYKSASLHRHKAAIKAYREFTLPGELWPFNRRQFTVRRRHAPRYVSPEVVHELIDATENEDDRMFVLTLFTLGCRINELMGIECGDLTPLGVKVLTKGGNTRLKPVTKEFHSVLSAYVQKKKKGKVFPRTYTYYYFKLKDLAKKTGHTEVTPHMLRHSRAVDLLRKGMSLPFVQQFLGHVNINTTAIYLEITGGELVQELEKVEAKANGS